MEAGILILLLIFGGFAAKKETVEAKSQPVELEKTPQKTKSKQIENIYDISNQRFFENIYQLEVKQYHFEGNVRKMDSYSTLSISSADVINFNDNYKDIDKNGLPFDIFYNFKVQLIPNDKETLFGMNYKINYNEKYNLENKNSSQFNINLEDYIKLNLNKKFEVTQKNYLYEFKLKKNKQSELYKNAETLDCKDDLTCEILKENTINFKKNKAKVVLQKSKNKNLKKPVNITKKNQLRVFNNYIIHKVENGETLLDLALQYDVPVLLIKKLNQLNRNNLKDGEKIVIANKSTKLHKIRKGENLFKISLKYNKKLSTLIQLNNLKNQNKILDDYYLIISL